MQVTTVVSALAIVGSGLAVLAIFLPFLRRREKEDLQDGDEAGAGEISAAELSRYVVQNDPIMCLFARFSFAPALQGLSVMLAGGGVIMVLSALEGRLLPTHIRHQCLIYSPGFWLAWFAAIPLGIAILPRYLRTVPEMLCAFRKGHPPILEGPPIRYRDPNVFGAGPLTTWTCIALFLATLAFQQGQSRILAEKGLEAWGTTVVGGMSAAKTYYTVAVCILLCTLALTIRKVCHNFIVLWRAFRTSTLHLRLQDRYGCGGLAPVGNLCAYTASIAILIALLVGVSSAWRIAYVGQQFFNVQTSITVGLFVLMAPAAFVGPALIVRKPVNQRKQELTEYYEHCLAQLESRLGERIPTSNEDREIKALRAQIAAVRSISLWPYSRRVVRFFVAKLIGAIMTIVATYLLARMGLSP